MNFKNIKIGFKKELLIIFRDKKFIRTILITPFIIPAVTLLMAFLFSFIEDSDYVVGINYELNSAEKEIIKSINEEMSFNVVTYESEDELKNAYDALDISSYVLKEDNVYTIYFDSSSTKSSYSFQMVNQYLSQLNGINGANYLINNNISVDDVFNTISIQNVNLASDGGDTLGTTLLQTVLSYIVMIIIISTVSLATDSTVGEKERGTLETLLTFPVKVNEIMAGKILSISAISAFTGLLSLVLGVVSFKLIGVFFDTFSSISFSSNIGVILCAILIIILTSILSALICIILCGKSRSFKEAQSSLAPITYLAIIPMFISMMEIKTNYLLYIIPIVNSGMLMDDIFFKGIDPLSIILMFASTAFYIFISLNFVSKQYKDEKTLFV